MSVVVAIAGGSGSGKSTFAKVLSRRLDKDAVILQQDDYYLPHPGMSRSELEKLNYDAPEALDSRLFHEQLDRLRQGEDIECPIYDYATHDRTDGTKHICSAPVIIVEGMLVLADERLRNMSDITVFVSVDEEERLRRRIERDVLLRGRSEDGVIEQFKRTVKPMHDKYVEPSALYADFTVEAYGDNTNAAEDILKRIKEIRENK